MFKAHRFQKIRNQKGQALIEYLILVALIAVTAAGVVGVVGQNVTAHFASISNALNGNSASRKTTQVKESAYNSTKNLSNFMENTNAHQ